MGPVRCLLIFQFNDNYDHDGDDPNDHYHHDDPDGDAGQRAIGCPGLDTPFGTVEKPNWPHRFLYFK